MCWEASNNLSFGQILHIIKSRCQCKTSLCLLSVYKVHSSTWSQDYHSNTLSITGSRFDLFTVVPALQQRGAMESRTFVVCRTLMWMQVKDGYEECMAERHKAKQFVRVSATFRRISLVWIIQLLCDITVITETINGSCIWNPLKTFLKLLFDRGCLTWSSSHTV